jgi:uncharacterized membrane protein (DUF106 family)
MVFEAINSIMNPLLSPVLVLQPLLAIGSVAVVISLLITVTYKFTTNQNLLKAIREEMKSIQKELRESRGDANKASELNKKLMQKTGQQMKHSMRSYIFTLIPVILIFSWMQGHVAYYNIAPGEEFTTTAWFEEGAEGEITLNAVGLEMLSPAKQEPEEGKVVWKLKGEAGKYELEYSFGNEVYKREVIITDKWEYKDTSLEKERKAFGINLGDKSPIRKESSIRKITTDLQSVHPLGGVSIFGWKPGWLMTYILFSLVFTFPMRKLLKVH